MRLLLLLLVIEKVIQHLVVTVALYLNGIRARLALDYQILLLAGAMEAAPFAVGAWSLLATKRWTAWLLLTLPTATAGGFLGRTRRTRQTGVCCDIRWRLGYRLRSTGVDFRRPCGRNYRDYRGRDSLLSPGLTS
jgi:hypothetical protein